MSSPSPFKDRTCFDIRFVPRLAGYVQASARDDLHGFPGSWEDHSGAAEQTEEVTFGGVRSMEVRGAPVTSTHWMGRATPPRTCDPWNKRLQT